MRIFVTGGSGFIGRHVVRKLLESGYEVLVYDLEEPLMKVPFVRGDIREFAFVKDAMRGSQQVVHLAAMVSAVEAMEKPLEAVETNVIGTFNVVEAARRNRVDKVVYAGSVAVYGEPKYLPIDEDHPTIPKNIYGASKLSGENLLSGYYGNYRLNYISLRFFNVYGPYMKPGPYAGVIYKFLERIKGENPLIIEGDGRQTRDFVYVEDVADAVLKALESEEIGIFNVGTGRETSIMELARLLFEITGANTGVEFSSSRPGDIRRSRADIGKIRRLGWRPRIDLREGLRKTVDWFFQR